MDTLKTMTTPMKVYKPYKLGRPPSLNSEEEKAAASENPSDEDVNDNGPMMITPAALLPSPPPQQLYLYHMMPAPAENKRRRTPPSPVSPFPPTSPTQPTPMGKTKPRIIHEYFDQHALQWREFNPEDTVVGDGTDPFIIYNRYASKSIGARRTPWVLPKHAKLVKGMQDCLPDLDWRTGEDMLIKARVLYLRRKAIQEAVDKLKRGESIGPVTKAVEETNLEEKNSESATTEDTEVEAETTKDDNEVSTKERVEDTNSSENAVLETPKATLNVSTPKIDGEDTSDTRSNASDIPPTPALTETSDSNPSELNPPTIIVDNVIQDATALRDASSDSSLETQKNMETHPSDAAKDGSDTITENSDIPHDEEERVEIEFPDKMNPDKQMEDWEMLEMVLNWVCKEFSADEEALARQLANSEISYRFLWLHYVPGSIVSLEDPVSKQQMAARIEFTEYIPQTVQQPPHLEINTKIIDSNGTDFIYSNMVANITEYDAAKRVEELPVQLLTEDLPLYQTLKERGKKFVQLNGIHYMTLDGVIVLKRAQEIIRVRSKTRVMIDCKAFRESNPSYNHTFSGLTLADLLGQPNMSPHHFPRYGLSTHGTPTPSGLIPGALSSTVLPKDIKSVPDEELVLCAPTVFGYAFTEKAWVQMTVEGISPVIWDTEAYNKLVLPDDTKKLVKSLVQACRTDTKLIKDIISTKGSGVVFVLHGEPGTGKTLTAEAIGEELRRPILVIAVSDLGTDPTNVEIRLGSFLRTAEKWDSIVLLDEADIFLEQRGRQDIFRNAMVGVFLRLLEYHNSPMFLTTNRVFAFDPAIRSRISIAIAYKPLKRVARKQVWQQLLDMAKAKISPADMDEVSMSQVNGREIKNTIRSAQALAHADGTDLTMRHIKTVLEVQKEFREDFEGLPGLWNGMGVS